MDQKRRSLAVVLALVFIVSAAGCAHDTNWIAKNGDETIPTGVYLTLMFSRYSEAQSLVEDPTKSPLNQTIDGIKGSDWIRQQTDLDMQKYIYVENKFDEMGLTLSDLMVSNAEQESKFQWQYMSDYYEANNISYDSMALVGLNGYKAEMLFEQYYGPNGEEPIDEDALLQKFIDQYYKIQFINAYYTDEDGKALDDAAKAAIDERFEKMVTDTQAGRDFMDVVSEYEKELLEEGEELHEHSDLSHITYMKKDDTGYPEGFMETIAGLDIDEVATIKTESSIFVVRKMDIAADPVGYEETYRPQLLYQEKGEEFMALLDGWARSVTVEYNEKAYDQCKPSIIKPIERDYSSFSSSETSSSESSSESSSSAE